MFEEGAFRNLSYKKMIIGIVAIIVVAFLIMYLYNAVFGYSDCKDWECFNKNLQDCSKTKFAGGTKMIFGYSIEGASKDFCIVNVELLQGELNNKDSQILEGKTMRCEIPLGIIMLPEKDLTNCHGILKENLQERVILQLHNYIVQNLGQINGELLNPLF